MSVIVNLKNGCDKMSTVGSSYLIGGILPSWWFTYLSKV